MIHILVTQQTEQTSGADKENEGGIVRTAVQDPQHEHSGDTTNATSLLHHAIARLLDSAVSKETLQYTSLREQLPSSKNRRSAYETLAMQKIKCDALKKFQAEATGPLGAGDKFGRKLRHSLRSLHSDVGR